MQEHGTGRFAPTQRASVDWFWKKIDCPTPIACWPWLGARSPRGYGKVGWGGRHFRAHRVAYELTFGEIPNGAVIMHLCDNPPCCNPNHLQIGTPAENATDRDVKGRRVNSNAKLTREQVEAIRQITAYYGYRRDLAAQYGVSRITISHIRDGTRWADHLPSPSESPR